MRQRALFIWILIISLTEISGQADSVVTGRVFRYVSFTEFVGIIESESSIRFFYKEEWVRNIYMTDSTGQESLGTILEHAFEKEDLYFYSDQGGHVIITRHQPVLSLSEDFFSGTEKLTATGIDIPSNSGLDLPEKQKDPENHFIRISNNGNGNSENGSSGIALSGRISEKESGEAVIGAVVYIEDKETGVITDENGYYLIDLERGIHSVVIRSVGRKEIRYQVEMLSSGSLDVEMEEQISQLKGVEIVAENTRNVTRLQLGMDKLQMKTVLALPAALGEIDVIKAALLLPGVQSVGEGASGLNVRGGSTGQNLFLINSAPIFNTSHLFGFFSVFNPDVISNFSLYKSGIPARYGGRLSSVFDVDSKTGNKKKFSVSGGISPITGRILVEGPIIKDKTSFVVGGRTTYSDWILNRVNVPAIRNSDARFHDLNMRVSHEFDASNKLEVGAYYSNDQFRLNNDTSYQYSNLNGSLTYTHHFSDKLLSSYAIIYSDYNYTISSEADPRLSFNLTNEIQYREAKADFAWYPSQQHKIKFGINAIQYRLNPGSRTAVGVESIISDLAQESERGIESAIYFSDEYRLNSKLLLYTGIRFSSFFYLGPKTVYSYHSDMPLEPSNVSGANHYGEGELIHTYMGPELRFSMRYIIDRYSSVKFSFNRMRQYLHMISNTTAISPTDSWKLSDPYFKPQIGDQLAVGYYFDLPGNKIETSTELYYKKLNNILEYKGGATLLMNDMLETELISGTGKAYGLEVMLKKKGRLSGWLGYTYSRIYHQVNGMHPSDQINSGEPFPANHDKPHDVSATGNFKISRRFAISSNFTYSTGRPITYPVARFEQRNNTLLQYSGRNEYRIPDYMRWDFSATLYGNLKLKKLAHSDWTLSIYNVTGRDNVYSIYFVSQGGETKGYKLSVFNRPIVTITYNFRIL